jgi:RNA polymerase sigma factor (sigma-70 family)
MADIINSYIQSIIRTPLLKKEQEIEIINRLPATKARNELIKANLRLVIYVAKGFIGRGLPLEDLIQEGSLGLFKAVEDFDKEKGFRFSTYAVFKIKGTIQNSLRKQRRIKEVTGVVTKLGDEEVSYIENLPAAEDMIDNLLAKDMRDKIEIRLQDLLKSGKLKERDIEIFKARVYMEYKLQEIADELDITRERVRQIEKKVKEKLNKGVNNGI